MGVGGRKGRERDCVGVPFHCWSLISISICSLSLIGKPRSLASAGPKERDLGSFPDGGGGAETSMIAGLSIGMLVARLGWAAGFRFAHSTERKTCVPTCGLVAARDTLETASAITRSRATRARTCCSRGWL